MAFTHSQMLLRHLGISSELARQYDRLASRVLYLDESLRAQPAVLGRNTLGPAPACGHTASLATCRSCSSKCRRCDDLRLVRQVLQAQEYWRAAGAPRRCRDPQRAPDRLPRRDARGCRDSSPVARGAPGTTGPEASSCCARTACRPRSRRCSTPRDEPCSAGSRGELVDNSIGRRRRTAPHVVRVTRRATKPTVRSPIRAPLLMANGLGGFSEDGREYVVRLASTATSRPPAPWSNILATPRLRHRSITSAGASFTWSVNSRENRLTPCDNDPVVRTARPRRLFVRDDDTGEIWGPTPGPLPRRQGDAWQVRHGRRPHSFERVTARLRPDPRGLRLPGCACEGIGADVQEHVDRPRRLSLFGYNGWVLGPPRRRHAALRGDRPRCDYRRARREQPVRHRIRVARGLRLVQRAGAVDDSAIARSSSGATARCRPRRPSAWRRSRTGSAPVSTRARRCTSACASSRASRVSWSSCSAKARRSTTCTRSSAGAAIVCPGGGGAAARGGAVGGRARCRAGAHA